MHITPDLVKKLLDYDQETGDFFWRSRGEEWFKSRPLMDAWNKRFSGKRAGSIHKEKSGYECIKIQIFGKSCQAHRLAWMWMKGVPAPREVDHINRNATDNRWDNIAGSCSKQNSKNKSMPSNNTSGVTGVCWSKSAKKWQAYISDGRKTKYLGWFKEIDEAAMEVLEARLDMGFSRGHGIDLAHYKGGES